MLLLLLLLLRPSLWGKMLRLRIDGRRLGRPRGAQRRRRLLPPQGVYVIWGQEFRDWSAKHIFPTGPLCRPHWPKCGEARNEPSVGPSS